MPLLTYFEQHFINVWYISKALMKMLSVNKYCLKYKHKSTFVEYICKVCTRILERDFHGFLSDFQ